MLVNAMVSMNHKSRATRPQQFKTTCPHSCKAATDGHTFGGCLWSPRASQNEDFASAKRAPQHEGEAECQWLQSLAQAQFLGSHKVVTTMGATVSAQGTAVLILSHCLTMLQKVTPSLALRCSGAKHI